MKKLQFSKLHSLCNLRCKNKLQVIKILNKLLIHETISCSPELLLKRFEKSAVYLENDK